MGPMARPRFLPDNFSLAILTCVLVASVFPCRGEVADAFDWLTTLAIALLFFMHGAKLSREAVLQGLIHWRLHLLVFGCTFVLFPVLAVLFGPLLRMLLGEHLYQGMIFLCLLPSTVQSSIAFVSLARGNVAAAVCSAAGSSLLGIFITPLLAAFLMDGQVTGATAQGSQLHAVGTIVVQLLLPFIAGQVARCWIGEWVGRNKSWLVYLDQSSILLVVYTAFSSAVVEGIWHHVPLSSLLVLVLVCALLLALVLGITSLAGRWLGFSVPDRITILFCGSKKSLATGVPIAKVLFPTSSIGLIILPIMIFHQIQLMVCSLIAQRLARRPMADDE